MKGVVTKNLGKDDMLLALGIFLLGIITRIPFASRMLFESDSARFALAMQQYDVTRMRPHAPGYILYVALAKFADLFFRDPHLSMVSISIISSALSVSLLYLLADKLYGRNVSIGSSLLLLSSPLFWYNGEMPLTYALEGLFSVVFAYACYKIIFEKKNWLFASALILGLATGVRQNIVILLVPLWLYAIRVYPMRKIIIAFILYGMTCLLWFIPMVLLSGGLDSYLSAIKAQYGTWVSHPSSFLFQIKERSNILFSFMILSLSIGIIPVFLYLIRIFKTDVIKHDRKFVFLVFWIVPAVLFFIGVNIWNPGHVVLVLPPLFICMAEFIRIVSKKIEKRYNGRNAFSSVFAGSMILLMALNAYVFIFEDTRVSYKSIKDSDSHLSELIHLTMENFTPENTLIIAFFYNTQAGYYLPNYRVYCPFPLIFSTEDIPVELQNVYISYRHETTPGKYWIPTGFEIEPITVPPGIENIVLWENSVAGYYQNPDRPLKVITSETNETGIYAFGIRPEEKIIYNYHYLSVGGGSKS